jgi:hypothetical protein
MYLNEDVDGKPKKRGRGEGSAPESKEGHLQELFG